MALRSFFSELLGTFALVFCGTGAIVIDQESGGAVTHPGVAATFGLIVMIMIFALGSISGAHLNPAVTVIFLSLRRVTVSTAAVYVAAQLIGAFLASLTLRFMFPGNEGLGTTQPSGSALQSFVLEIILAMILMLVILNVTSGKKDKDLIPAIAIGATVGLEALFAGPVCGASMNPARSLAPAVVSGHTAGLWIYLLAPVIGAFIALAAHKLLFLKHE